MAKRKKLTGSITLEKLRRVCQELNDPLDLTESQDVQILQNADRWLKVKKAFSICDHGALLIATSKCRSWKEYAQKHWNWEFFDWAVQIFDGEPYNPNDAYWDHLNFKQFVKAYPKYKWPKNWPLPRG